MKYIMTFIWSFLLVSMLSYVVGAVMNVEFTAESFQNGAIISVVFSVLIFVIGAVIPNESTPEVDHN